MVISNVRARSVLQLFALASAFVIATMVLRGPSISEWNVLNPDEVELMAEARVAMRSPLPFSTWITGTNGPYSVYFLAALGALGAPLTPVFAHLLAAVLVGLTAFVVLVSASRVIGTKPAVVFTLVWWFSIAAIFPLGTLVDFGAMSTEYLPMLLVAASALVSREQLAARPWLFGVVGLLAGVAVGVKYQIAAVAVAFAVAQVIVMRPKFSRIVVMGLWWVAGALLPALALVLVMVASSATNWTLVDQMLLFLGDYAGRTPMDKLVSTVQALKSPGYYLAFLLLGLLWLGWHSDKRANIARVVLVAGGFAAMLAGGMGFGHYNILLFGSAALAATMPVSDAEKLLPQRISTAVLSGIVVVWAAVGVLCLCSPVYDWWPLSPRAAAAAFSSDSVHRNPTFTRVCPPGTPAVVWGWAAEIYLVQGWRSTIPYQDVVQLSKPAANRETGEPLVRAGIDRAQCVVEATGIRDKYGRPMPIMALLPFYPRLAPVLHEQFHLVPIEGGCDGCRLYVRNSAP